VDNSVSTVKKFYTMGSTTVAVRTVSGTEDVLNWILGDHYGAQRSTPVAQRRGPGSASVTANADGSWNSEIKYCEASPKQSAGDTAFGEVRASSGLTPTEYRYTGQMEAAELGLYYYVARWYDPALGHFVQADSIIPEPANVANWNRYAYTNYNPLIYSDPSGHIPIPVLLAILGLGIFFSQYPGEYSTPETAGNPSVMLIGLSLMGPVGDAIATTADCVMNGCDPTLLDAYPGPGPSMLDNTANSLDNINMVDDFEKPNLVGGIGDRIFKKGAATYDNVTPRPGWDDLDLDHGGLSFFNSIDNMLNSMSMKEGDKYLEVDPKKLDGLQVIFDNHPAGHISVRPETLSQLQEWASTRKTGNIHRFTATVFNAIDRAIKWK